MEKFNCKKESTNYLLLYVSSSCYVLLRKAQLCYLANPQQVIKRPLQDPLQPCLPQAEQALVQQLLPTGQVLELSWCLPAKHVPS